MFSDHLLKYVIWWSFKMSKSYELKWLIFSWPNDCQWMICDIYVQPKIMFGQRIYIYSDDVVDSLELKFSITHIMIEPYKCLIICSFLWLYDD